MRRQCFTGHPFLDGGAPEPLRFTLDGSLCDFRDLIPKLPMGGELYHFGLSGGKDSQAALLWAIKVAKLPIERIIVSACDTGNEHPATYRQMELVDERLHPVIMIKPGLDFWGLVDRKGMFPTRRRRFCTQYLKMQPTQRFVHYLESLGYSVILYSGVRAAESPERAQLPAQELDDFFGCVVRRPLLTWTYAQVIGIHTEYNFPLNPLYAMGARRVGCFPCINSVKEEMRIVPEVAPEKVVAIRNKELEITLATGGTKTFFHRKTVPVRFRTQKFTAKSGEEYRVCSIDDVIQWAKWFNKSEVKAMQRKKQKELTFGEDGFQACQAGAGYCE